jgi:FlaA1/EpsC-like NDP-sugar epimerase
MSPAHFKKQKFEDLLEKALYNNDREEVFFSDTSNEKVIEICNDIDALVESKNYNMNDDIVILGFRMGDKRVEPIFSKLLEKYDNDIEYICLYTLIALYLNEKKVPLFEDVKKYIVYDAVYGSGQLFYNMSYV